jgi:ribosomal protein L11 methyltransferase
MAPLLKVVSTSTTWKRNSACDWLIQTQSNTMPWLQLLTETDRNNAPALEDALLQAGAVSVTFQEYIPPGDNEKPILEPGLGETPLWEKTRVVGLFNTDCDTKKVDWLLSQLLSQELSQKCPSRWEQLEDKDWEREWMQNYQPIQCADNLWICPSWLTPPNPQATNVMLDPGLAFGTGTHPTTFLCMQWLAQQDLNNQYVIDYGCGSGILGVTALLLGANKALGIDIDPQALLASNENTQRNGLDPERFPVYLPETAPQESADIMVANILAAPLVDLAEDILAQLKPGGRICLSGILADQAQEVMNAYAHFIDFTPVTRKEEWVRLDGIKRNKRPAHASNS